MLVGYTRCGSLAKPSHLDPHHGDDYMREVEESYTTLRYLLYTLNLIPGSGRLILGEDTYFMRINEFNFCDHWGKL